LEISVRAKYAGWNDLDDLDDLHDLDDFDAQLESQEQYPFREGRSGFRNVGRRVPTDQVLILQNNRNNADLVPSSAACRSICGKALLFR
jgi:hypothetical protein